MKSRSVRRQLLRTLCRILRHDSHALGLSLQPHGFLAVDEVLEAINRVGRKAPISRQQLIALLVGHDDRFELRGDQVRARYGHSRACFHLEASDAPPPTLFHGTYLAALDLIRRFGLQPMSRSYLHLTTDLDYAWRIALKGTRVPAIVQVDTAAASRAGIVFHRANRHVWLCGPLPPPFLTTAVREPALPADIDQRLAALAADGQGGGIPVLLRDQRPFYHVCPRCNAKWFGREARMRCPRCGGRCASSERRMPPWLLR